MSVFVSGLDHSHSKLAFVQVVDEFGEFFVACVGKFGYVVREFTNLSLDARDFLLKVFVDIDV